MESATAGAGSPSRDHAICVFFMALSALAITLANNLDLYKHIGIAVAGLSVGIAFCGAAVMLPSLRKFNCTENWLVAMMGLVIAVEISLWQPEHSTGQRLSLFIAATASIIFFAVRASSGRHLPPLLAMAGVFFVAVSISIHRPSNVWSDVLMSQQKACQYLLHGTNPYAATYPNIYGRNTPLYAPELVDSDNHLTAGFGYPPLSLLMLLPSYLIAGDVRYGLAGLVAASAILIGLSAQRRTGILAAAALLAAPQWSRMLTFGWCEPVLIFNFSLVMFCACRWRGGLPWTLGLFLATKQYAILAFPILPLLLEPGRTSRDAMKQLIKPAMLLAAINAPFVIWGPAAFVRSLITAHFMQPFRPDALSYSAWIYRHADGWILPMWVALLAMSFAIAEVLWRGVRSPAGFASALTFVLLLFFAFNKQAFCNYYYFIAASAWWSVSAAELPAAAMQDSRGCNLSRGCAQRFDLITASANAREWA